MNMHTFFFLEFHVARNYLMVDCLIIGTTGWDKNQDKMVIYLHVHYIMLFVGEMPFMSS